MEKNEPGSRIRVFHVDDDADARALMGYLLRFEPDMEEVGSRAGVDGVLDDLVRSPADLLIIDLMLRGAESIEAIRAVRFAHPEMRILVLSGCSDPSVLQRAYDAGATECLLKSPSIDATLQAIRRAESACHR